ncbi:hypothetical protein CI102_1175 [Trichoderma harzianum]|uniref:Uncharacterized protein n=1 Tax=Trichoderma harzianum CBS 226.95 TaxID=983964 RepID=A0A2T3ZUW0_TRIHA|nr:hypothetical protein M431DRAFT_325979 [Trichoderma harzianum CBS 226.95]PKK53926.1 hypothetical protein CI102_1175 [Trichoderma harzianum]PTB48612.1 hypothetical protein M431DRAFT_325979 [Trichoderma harzianum CBS 226.95]
MRRYLPSYYVYYITITCSSRLDILMKINTFKCSYKRPGSIPEQFNARGIGKLSFIWQCLFIYFSVFGFINYPGRWWLIER